jgi:hypothetical protein
MAGFQGEPCPPIICISSLLMLAATQVEKKWFISLFLWAQDCFCRSGNPTGGREDNYPQYICSNLYARSLILYIL